MMRLRRRKLSYYSGARWRWDGADNIGFIFLPSKEDKLIVIRDQWQYNFTVGLLEKVNSPTRLQQLWSTIKPRRGAVQLGTTAFDLAIGQYRAAQAKQEPEVIVQRAGKISRGRVVKETKSPEWDPDNKKRGGRVVRVMPRQLQRMKAAQEKTDDD